MLNQMTLFKYWFNKKKHFCLRVESGLGERGGAQAYKITTSTLVAAGVVIFHTLFQFHS